MKPKKTAKKTAAKKPLPGASPSAPPVPPTPPTATPAPAPDERSRSPFPFARVTIENGSEISVEVELSLGDVTETPARVILLGQFQGMDPTTAVQNLDRAMHGALLKLIALRRSTHGAGELDIIPTGRHPVMAELVAFLGLGHWTLFSGPVLASSFQSGVRALLASHFDEVATVLMGGRLPDQKEIDVGFSLRHMFRGLIQALREDPQRDRFRRIVIVEKNEDRLREAHALLRVMVQEEEFKGVRTTLCFSRLPVREPLRDNAGARPTAAAAERHLLMLTTQPVEVEKDSFRIDAVLHSSNGGASIIRRERTFPNKKIGEIYEKAQVSTKSGVTSVEELKEVTELVIGILPEGVLEELATKPESRLELIHDAESARLPWECLQLPGGDYPALKGGFSRRFVSERSAVIWMPKPVAQLRILLVVDPLGDLPNALAEGQSLLQALPGKSFQVTPLWGADATRENLKRVLIEGTFDIVHYCGHSGFDRSNPRFSGLLLHGEEYFTGADVLELAQFPPILVFNSCESARIRRRDPVLIGESAEKLKKDLSKSVLAKIRNRDAAHGALSIAEAFLTAGVQHYVGTFWPVGDVPARLFGLELYEKLSAGEPFGAAVRSARKVLHRDGHPDWANYIHYGNPDAVICPPAAENALSL